MICKISASARQGEMVNERQSLSGYIREHLERIERQLDVGVRQEAIIEELKLAGYTTKVENLRNELWRARKRKQLVVNVVHTKGIQGPSELLTEARPQLSENENFDEPDKLRVEEDTNTSYPPSKRQLENRANKYIKGSLDGAPIDDLLNRNKGK